MSQRIAEFWNKVGLKFLPFADAASERCRSGG